jgi:hypothetical protein
MADSAEAPAQRARTPRAHPPTLLFRQRSCSANAPVPPTLLFRQRSCSANAPVFSEIQEKGGRRAFNPAEYQQALQRFRYLPEFPKLSSTPQQQHTG